MSKRPLKISYGWYDFRMSSTSRSGTKMVRYYDLDDSIESLFQDIDDMSHEDGTYYIDNFKLMSRYYGLYNIKKDKNDIYYISYWEDWSKEHGYNIVKPIKKYKTPLFYVKIVYFGYYNLQCDKCGMYCFRSIYRSNETIQSLFEEYKKNYNYEKETRNAKKCKNILGGNCEYKFYGLRTNSIIKLDNFRPPSMIFKCILARIVFKTLYVKSSLKPGVGSEYFKAMERFNSNKEIF